MQWSSFPLLFNLNVRKREEKAAHLALCLRTPANLGGFSRVCQETHQKVVSEGGANRLCCCYRFALWHHKRLIFICSIFWTACMSTLSLQGWASEKEQKSSLPCSRYGLKKKKKIEKPEFCIIWDLSRARVFIQRGPLCVELTSPLHVCVNVQKGLKTRRLGPLETTLPAAMNVSVNVLATCVLLMWQAVNMSMHGTQCMLGSIQTPSEAP